MTTFMGTIARVPPEAVVLNPLGPVRPKSASSPAPVRLELALSPALVRPELMISSRESLLLTGLSFIYSESGTFAFSVMWSPLPLAKESVGKRPTHQGHSNQGKSPSGTDESA